MRERECVNVLVLEAVLDAIMTFCTCLILSFTAEMLSCPSTSLTKQAGMRPPEVFTLMVLLCGERVMMIGRRELTFGFARQLVVSLSTQWYPCERGERLVEKLTVIHQGYNFTD